MNRKEREVAEKMVFEVGDGGRVLLEGQVVYSIAFVCFLFHFLCSTSKDAFIKDTKSLDEGDGLLALYY